ncbi:MAG: phospholipid carrier-dependent glycosyltransferase [Pyrinomonadaceae bacterium]
MHSGKNDRAKWPILVLLSAIPRLLGAFLLPNAFGDAYVYIQEIGRLSTRLSTGAFRLTDLFGFWLPLYQFLSAIVNVAFKNGFYTGKLVAALFGVGSCLFVYALTFRLTANRTGAMLMFLLIAFNPLHIFYSASAMTDVPHAFFVLAALYFVLTGNWIVAATFGAMAGFTRVESWMLIGLIPLSQFIKEHRISIIALVVLIVPPLFWFCISWQATGNLLACFIQRQEYHDWLLRMNPSIARFSLRQILKDGATLLVSSDVAVLIACFVAGWFVAHGLRQMVGGRKNSAEAIGGTGAQESSLALSILAPVLFFFAFFGLLAVAYLTHQQPIIFPRYGLILFSLGLPILAWTFLKVQKDKPRLAPRLLISIIAICVFDASVQFVGAVGTLNQYHAQRAVGDYLRDHFDLTSKKRIFCDDGNVRVLSGIPDETFMTSANAPKDREAFLNFLNQENVEYLIVVETERSAPFELFPSSEYNERIGDFQSVMYARSNFIKTNIQVYRSGRSGQ